MAWAGVAHAQIFESVEALVSSRGRPWSGKSSTVLGAMALNRKRSAASTSSP
jgi:hypothetical protein